MRKSYRILAFTLLAVMFSLVAPAQTSSITGTVKSSLTNEVVPAVSVLVKGGSQGTYTNDKGHFTISISQKFPVTLVFTSIGYESKEMVVTSASQVIDIMFKPISALAQEVVVSASRRPENILESPVTVEKVNALTIRNTAQSNYYDIIGSLKGVDMVTSSLLFKTPSTRGFNSSGNLRLNQLVDGMDNQAPGLNFSVGNLVGVTELDVDNMELLGGASSALYGPGGMNGTLLINSKNPFKYQGLSWQVKQGVNHIDRSQRSLSPFYDWTFRWAKQVSEKFAFKIGGQYTQTKDWVATDERNFVRGTNPATGKVAIGNRLTAPNYNGINIYGDETQTDIRPFLQGALAGNPALAPIINPLLASPQFVTRTGYSEREVIDPTTLNVKLSGALHYKINNATEASFTGYWGYGNTVYTGSDRYALNAVKIGQYKLEVKNTNWFIRGYTTQENSGDSYNATAVLGLAIEAWKPSFNPANVSGSWLPQYTSALVGALAQGATSFNAHNSARAFADIGRPAANSQQFKDFFNQIRSKPIGQGGGKFLDKSDLYMAEGQYNLTSLIKVADVIVGANYKEYVLNSENTLFAEQIFGGPIKIKEFGSYAQVSKSLFNNVLRLTASGRFDKQDNFKGRFTPRFSAVVKVAPEHFVRLSYQNAYRFPSTQNQWIDLVIGGGVRLIGGLPQLRDFYNFTSNPVYTPESVQAFGASGNPALLVKRTFGEYKPEEAKSYEIGYKGLIGKKLLIDVYGYYTEYKNFIGRTIALQSSNSNVTGLATPKIYSVSVNSPTKVNTQGWGASAEYLLPNNFSISGNIYSDEIMNVPTNFVAYFNAPKIRTNLGLANSGIFCKKRIGFNLNMHYQDGVYFEGDFGSGQTLSYITLDAQVSYKFIETKSILKLGATNLTNTYYRNAFGNPMIGGLYYLSFGYNIF